MYCVRCVIVKDQHKKSRVDNVQGRLVSLILAQLLPRNGPFRSRKAGENPKRRPRRFFGSDLTRMQLNRAQDLKDVSLVDGHLPSIGPQSWKVVELVVTHDHN
jgi:hypothetical protein